MTQAIAQDPVFMEMAKEMQEAMLAGGMGGLNLGGEGGEGGGEGGAAARGPGAMPGMPGMPPMPGGIDPAKYMQAMQRVMQNPEFLQAAESLGRGLMSQVRWAVVVGGQLRLGWRARGNAQGLLAEAEACTAALPARPSRSHRPAAAGPRPPSRRCSCLPLPVLLPPIHCRPPARYPPPTRRRQVADPETASMMELFSNPDNQALLKAKMEELKEVWAAGGGGLRG